MARPTRRSLLGAAGVMALAGGAVAAGVTVDAGHPDAGLIALCDRFASLEQRIVASYEAHAGRGQTVAEEDLVERAERQPLREEQFALLPLIVEARATTLDGFRARARAIMTYEKDGPEEQEISPGPVAGGMAWALVRDLVGAPL